MENMINIAEILKDCPKGMELDCTMYNGVVTLEQVQPLHTYSIKIRVKCGDESFTNVLTKYGQISPSPCNKCVIFPKGKTAWDGFQRPFKDGDVVVSKSESWIGIVKSYNKYDKTYDVYVAFENWRENYINIHVDIKLEFSRLATEEEKEKFFKAIKDNGYQWDPETKTLYKPEFKDGDVVINDRGNIFIYKGLLYNDKNRVDFYCGYLTNEHAFVIKESKDSNFGSIDSLRLATEEEKQILFDAIERQKLFYAMEKEKQFYAIKDNGYQGDSKTKTLYKSKFKDGDVCTGKVSGSGNLVIFIYKERINTTIIKSHFTLVGACKNCYIYLKDEEIRFATEEEKQRLFHVIKENGYRWDSETKTLYKSEFKDGDVCTGKVNGNLVIFIYNNRINTTLVKSHFVLYVRAGFCKNCCIALKDEEIKFATEEEKQELFKAIQDNGYRWDADTKTLRVVGKLGKLKFKVGDVVQDKECNKVKITEVVHECGCYLYKTEIANEIGKIYFDEENDWELVPNKFDITTLKPFDKVLVRDENGQKWMCDIFSYYDDKNPRYPFWGVGRSNSKQCIPYEGNEYLVGTTNDCDEFYKNW